MNGHISRGKRRLRLYSIVRIVITAISILVVVAGSRAASAADCQCKVACTSAASGVFATEQNSWPGYSNWFPQWKNCKQACDGYLNGLNLEEIAKSKGVCGRFSCTSEYTVGVYNWRSGSGRVANRECGADAATGDSQYAAKLVCGSAADDLRVSKGDYTTAINVHNPQPGLVEMRTKVALAGQAEEGPISPFTLGAISPDGAQRFTCQDMRARLGYISPLPALLDGFFVLEARQPLDVVGVYTNNPGATSDSSTRALELKQVPERKIEKSPWCTTNLQIDLAKTQWSIDTPAGQRFSVQVPGVNWSSSRRWVGTMLNANGVPSAPIGLYTYRRDFCSCGGSVYVFGDVTADNDLNGYGGVPTGVESALVTPTLSRMTLLSSSSTPAQRTNVFQQNPVPFNMIAATGAGSYALEVLVWNNDEGSYTGLSAQGTITVTSGYPGKCIAP